ncbi:MAG: tetratricopeptide repeat protein [Candidatus Dactylopiibacterium sp.]|nr:tetratricopeptide repeat protein [Candidatus Dactylopiibacterium sp.]
MKNALLLAVMLALGACGAIPVRNEPVLSSRKLSAPAAAPAPGSRTAAAPAAALPAARETRHQEGLRLARLLREQARFQAAVEVYSQLERDALLSPLERLEYASTAAAVLPAQDALALFGRARRELQRSGEALSAAASISLCGGLGRARLGLDQADAALEDFDCVLRLAPDDVAALNGRGVALDALDRHEEARAAFARALALDPADLRVLNNLALSWLASGNGAEAIRLLKQAGVAGLPTARLNLALAYLLEGDAAQGRRTLDALLPPRVAAQAWQALEAHGARIRAGASVNAELMAASREIVALREAARP